MKNSMSFRLARNLLALTLLLTGSTLQALTDDEIYAIASEKEVNAHFVSREDQATIKDYRAALKSIAHDSSSFVRRLTSILTFALGGITSGALGFYIGFKEANNSPGYSNTITNQHAISALVALFLGNILKNGITNKSIASLTRQAADAFVMKNLTGYKKAVNKLSTRLTFKALTNSLAYSGLGGGSVGLFLGNKGQFNLDDDD